MTLKLLTSQSGGHMDPIPPASQMALAKAFGLNPDIMSLIGKGQVSPETGQEIPLEGQEI